jgi:aryl-alcohol dehydrogenase-like predicted oxidoreductase
LQVETIDLYQCHWPDEGTPIEETLSVFDELVKSGKIRHIGASNYCRRSSDALAWLMRRNCRASRRCSRTTIVHRKEYEAELALCAARAST